MVKQEVSRKSPGRPSARGLVLPRVPWTTAAATASVLSFVSDKALVLTYSDGGN